MGRGAWWGVALGMAAVVGSGWMWPVAAQHGHEDGHQAAPAADVSGAWEMSFAAPWGDVDMVLDLTPQEGRLRGFATWGTRRVMLEGGRVRDDQVSFVIMAGDGVTHSIEMRFQGRVRGDRMEGTVDGWSGHGPASWTASKKKG